MTKRLLAVGLAFLLIFVAACSGGGSSSPPASSTPAPSSTSSSSSSGEAPAEQQFDKKYDVTYLSGGFENYVENTWQEQELERLYNIDIIPVKINIQDKQQVDLMLASGEMPDFGYFGRSSLELYEQGVSRTIPRHLIEEYAPRFAEMLSSHPMGWLMHQSPDNPDEYMALTGYFGDVSVYFHSNYRLDWLEKLGIEPKGPLTQIDDDGRIFLSEEPFTQEEHFEIMRRFVEDDPDGDGAKNTYGMTAISTLGWDSYSWSTLLGMFGIGYAGESGTNLEENGTTLPFFVSEAYKDFLKYMKSLYDIGALDPEFVTHDWARFHEVIAANRAGYWPNQHHYFNLDYLDRQPSMVLNNNPEAKILIVPPETGLNGKGGTNAYGWNPFNYQTFIGAQVDDEKLIRLLQLFDFIYFDEEARLWARAGQEGINWEWEGEPHKSAFKFLEEPTEKTYNGFNANIISPDELLVLYAPKMASKVRGYFINEGYEKYGIFQHRVDPFNTTQYASMWSEYGAGIGTLRMEFLFNVITGRTDLDAEWDNYLQQMNSLGLDKLIEELNKMPLMSEFR